MMQNESPPHHPAVFHVCWRGEKPRRMEAADAYSAAAAFQALFETRINAEIVVVSENGIESVFGYRQMIPTEHLDD